MSIRNTMPIAFAIALLFAASMSPGTLVAQNESGTPQAREDVLAANQAFYTALNAMFEGDIAPMEKVWSHADDTTYFPPTGEMLAGWTAIRNSWQAQANLKLGGEVHTEDVSVIVGSEMAVVGSREIGSNPNTPSGPMKVDIRVTKVFRIEGGEWKLVHFHTDKLPQLAATIN